LYGFRFSVHISRVGRRLFILPAKVALPELHRRDCEGGLVRFGRSLLRDLHPHKGTLPSEGSMGG